MSLMLADHHRDSRDHQIQVCDDSVCGERPGSHQFTVSGEEAAQSECRKEAERKLHRCCLSTFEFFRHSLNLAFVLFNCLVYELS